MTEPSLSYKRKFLLEANRNRVELRNETSQSSLLWGLVSHDARKNEGLTFNLRDENSNTLKNNIRQFYSDLAKSFETTLFQKNNSGFQTIDVQFNIDSYGDVNTDITAQQSSVFISKENISENNVKNVLDEKLNTETVNMKNQIFSEVVTRHSQEAAAEKQTSLINPSSVSYQNNTADSTKNTEYSNKIEKSFSNLKKYISQQDFHKSFVDNFNSKIDQVIKTNGNVKSETGKVFLKLDLKQGLEQTRIQLVKIRIASKILRFLGSKTDIKLDESFAKKTEEIEDAISKSFEKQETLSDLSGTIIKEFGVAFNDFLKNMSKFIFIPVVVIIVLILYFFKDTISSILKKIINPFSFFTTSSTSKESKESKEEKKENVQKNVQKDVQKTK